MGLEIGYAYPSFKWTNNAKGNAGVTVAVISLQNVSNGKKYIFDDEIKREVEFINGYLSDGANTIVSSRRIPLTDTFPQMKYGMKPIDGGNLLLDPIERDQLVEEAPESIKFIKTFLGSREFIRGEDRYCLWITEKTSIKHAKFRASTVG